MNNFKLNLNRNLKSYSPYIPNINKTTLRSILKLCVTFLQSKETYDKEFIKAAATKEGLTQEDFAVMFTCISILIETFLRSKNVSQNELSESLRELKFANECIDDLNKVLLSNQQSLLDQFQETKLLKPMDKFDYRINISLIESGSTIILCLEQRGKSQVINLSLKHFHRFRLTVASILSEMYALEGKKS